MSESETADKQDLLYKQYTEAPQLCSNKTIIHWKQGNSKINWIPQQTPHNVKKIISRESSVSLRIYTHTYMCTYINAYNNLKHFLIK